MSTPRRRWDWCFGVASLTVAFLGDQREGAAASAHFQEPPRELFLHVVELALDSEGLFGDVLVRAGGYGGSRDHDDLDVAKNL
jgi:hypothetical protein